MGVFMHKKNIDKIYNDLFKSTLQTCFFISRLELLEVKNIYFYDLNYLEVYFPCYYYNIYLILGSQTKWPN